MKIFHRITATLLLVLASVTLAGCGARSDGFDWGRLVLFSAVSGKVLDKGKPVAGLTLTRSVEWKGDTYVDTTTTDKDGGFAFPVLKRFGGLYLVLPAEPRISQSISTVHLGKEYEIWGYLKGGYDNNGELLVGYTDSTMSARITIADPEKVPIVVTCDLATKMQLDADGEVNSEWRAAWRKKGGITDYCLVD